MKKLLTTVSVLTAISLTSVHADFIGFEVGAGYWNAKTSGNFQKGTTKIDLEDDLNYGGSNGTNTFYAVFEHPVPLIPNIKIQQTNLTDSSQSTLSKAINFNNENFVINSDVQTSIKLNQTDFIIYYEILDNWVNLDLGLNVKYIDASVELNSITTNATDDFSVYIPMLYGKAQFDLPFSGLSAETELSYIGYSGNSFYDAKVALQYEYSLGFGAELGYREIKLKLDDLDNFNSDIKFSGAYVSVFYHF